MPRTPKEPVSTTNASKRGGNNKTGKGGFKDNPANRNNAGQRKREQVQTAAQARELYVAVLHEPIGTQPNPQMSNLEMIVRQHVQAAKKGDERARETMFDRIWGKAIQQLDHTSSDGTMTPQAVMFVPWSKPDVSANSDDS